MISSSASETARGAGKDRRGGGAQPRRPEGKPRLPLLLPREDAAEERLEETRPAVLSRGKGEGVERDVVGCFSKEDEVSRSFGGSRRAAASRASSPSPSPSVKRILRKLLRAPLAPWRPAPQRGSVRGESSCVRCASRSVARFERPSPQRPRRRLKFFESSVVGSGKERQKNQKTSTLARRRAFFLETTKYLSRGVRTCARGARGEGGGGEGRHGGRAS